MDSLPASLVLVEVAADESAESPVTEIDVELPALESELTTIVELPAALATNLALPLVPLNVIVLPEVVYSTLALLNSNTSGLYVKLMLPLSEASTSTFTLSPTVTLFPLTYIVVEPCALTTADWLHNEPTKTKAPKRLDIFF